MCMEKVIPLVIFGFSMSLINRYSFGILFISSLIFLVLSLCRRKDELSVFLLTFIVASLFGFESILPSSVSVPMKAKDTLIVGGKIISIPSYRGNETRGYNIELTCCSDGEGNWYSANGKLYVISKLGNEDLGDVVVLKGKMMDGYFLSSSSIIERRNSFGRGRRRFLSLFTRSLEKGEVGNLTSLLITGSSLDGSKEIQDMGRAMGISHLFALSGMHLAFILMMTQKPLSLIVGKREGAIISKIIAFIFVYINGFRPSLLRAFLLMMLSSYFGVGYAHVLSLLLMIKTTPYVLYDYGAALSFSALSGILIFTDGFRNTMAMIMSSLGALTATVPLSLKLFSSWSLASLFLSIPGGIVIEILFFIIVIKSFIPKLDYIILQIYEFINKIPSIIPALTQYDLKLYWPLMFTTLSIFLINKAFPFIERWIIIKVCGTSTTTALKRLKEY